MSNEADSPLFRALESVAASPYAPSLRALSRELEKSKPSEVTKWVNIYTCRIPSLARLIISALEYEPYAPTVIEKLAVVEQIRDAILEYRPSVIDASLKAATTSESNFQKYASMCTSLLSHPLPSGLPHLPGSLQSFLAHLVKLIFLNPNRSNIRLLYRLLQGKHGEVQDVLTRGSTSYGLHTALGGCLSADQSGLVFLALACLARIMSRSESASENLEMNRTSDANGLEASAGMGTPTSSGRSLFAGDKGGKVLRLAANVIISAATGGDDDEEVVSLALVVVEAIDADVVRTWAESREGMFAMRKLAELLSNGNIPHSATLQQIAEFLTCVVGKAGASSLGAKVIKSLQFAIGEALWREVSYASTPAVGAKSRIASAEATKSLCELLSAMDPFEDTSFVEILKSGYLLAASSGRNPPSIANLCAVVAHVSALQTFERLVETWTPLRNAFLSALATNEFMSPVTRFLDTEPLDVKAESCAGMQGKSNACPGELRNARLDLIKVLCMLPLKVNVCLGGEPTSAPGAVVIDQSDHDSLDANLSCNFINKLSSLVTASPQQSRHHPYNGSSGMSSNFTNGFAVSIVQESSTPYIHANPSYEWQQRLLLDLNQEAAHRHENLVKEMGKICRDLEERCMNVEAPLRLAQSQARKFAEELGNAKRMYEQLQTTTEEGHERVTFEMNSLRDEKERLETAVGELVSEVEEATSRSKSLEDQLASQAANNDELKLLLGRETARGTELEQCLAQERDAMTNLRVHAAELDQNLSSAREELKAASEELQRRAEAMASLQTEVHEKTAVLDEARDEAEAHQVQIGELEERATELENIVTSEREASAQKDEAIGNMQQEAEALRRTLIEVNNNLHLQQEAFADSERSRASLDSKLKEARMLHEHTVKTSREELNDLRQQFAERESAMVTENKQLMKKLAKLQGLHEKQRVEIAQAQELSRKLSSLFPGATILGQRDELPTSTTPQQTESVPLTAPTVPVAKRSRRSRSPTPKASDYGDGNSDQQIRETGEPMHEAASEAESDGDEITADDTRDMTMDFKALVRDSRRMSNYAATRFGLTQGTNYGTGHEDDEVLGELNQLGI
ncbi:hypothetical protein SAICODRAFT_127637 [Saitoella complicata NRRL Y-17804]|uniref:Uncharacterized protein n=1 Tax=Saitoella complicata (strain BCRC 22490 / CBS 7301 / JCM 7358 / NBRC 10748 / NRRL Y-17804) TaxID=698492 RepID=A0A0E9NKP3_SAICN|nr:uncharacterized protein SAICODRAFT_127637 [Saitoella complicata NRRL Y-17804]ODQ52799.1 hypothetical protein SAICODRAFT_127637 [Saitoella complicata NRRL Y-17804]GAO50404.1 hypothetical protein G7K_4530-t1 [Saitoella complicata NRRL Y-17804]